MRSQRQDLKRRDSRILERAKGLEPSTPTLARSCSTTELHPHPRWRRSLAGNGRAMPNAARECNSPYTVRTRPNNPSSRANKHESARNGAKTADYPPFGLATGEPGSCRQCIAQRFEPFPERAGQSAGQLVALAGVAIEGRPPFHEGPVAIDNRRDPQGGLIAGHRQRRRATEFVGLGTLDVGLRQ